MLRILITLSTVFLFSGENFKEISAEQGGVYLGSQDNIDPLITGHSVSDEHKSAWQKRADAYNRCGLCGAEMQPYPGD